MKKKKRFITMWAKKKKLKLLKKKLKIKKIKIVKNITMWVMDLDDGFGFAFRKSLKQSNIKDPVRWPCSTFLASSDECP